MLCCGIVWRQQCCMCVWVSSAQRGGHFEHKLEKQKKVICCGQQAKKEERQENYIYSSTGESYEMAKVQHSDLHHKFSRAQQNHTD